jgi:hypothetical protein
MPFFEQKRACNKLVRYLRLLKRDCEPDESAATNHPANHNADSCSDSADDFPESFKMLNINSNTKKRNYVRKYVKKTMPITHSIDYIKLFSEIDVEIPKTYGEIDEALTNVQKVLEFFNDQTNLDHADDFSDLASMVSSMDGSSFMDSPLLSPRSASSCSLVLADEPSPTPFEHAMAEPELNFHFPK